METETPTPSLILPSMDSLSVDSRRTLSVLLSEYRRIKSKLAPLVSSAEIIKAEIDSLCTRLNIAKIESQITLVPGQGRIDKIKLLELGVGTEIIEAATKKDKPHYRVLNGESNNGE